MKARFAEVVAVTLTLIWRGFGLFLFILGGSAGAGAVIAGSWIMGVAIAWVTLMIGVVGVLGYAIATTGRATTQDVERGIRDAIQKAKSEQDKK